MMNEAIMRFTEQFDWQPHVENATHFNTYKNYIVCGMGGSALAPWLIKYYGAQSGSLMFHREYGLPIIAEDALKESLIILSSYSGDTEEVLDSAREAIERGFSIAMLTKGGRLLKLAQDHNLPYVLIPDMGLEPRMAIGLSMLGIARLMQNIELEDSIRAAGKTIDPAASRDEGQRIAEKLRSKIPLIYSSAANLPLAYIWKIKCNESAKIPAFYNAFPELCHNELSGFDITDSTRALSANIHAIFLEDDTDHPRIQKRMQIASQIFGEKGVPVEHVNLLGEASSVGRLGFEKAFYTALLADWVSLELAQYYHVPDAETPLIADFKRRMAE